MTCFPPLKVQSGNAPGASGLLVALISEGLQYQTLDGDPRHQPGPRPVPLDYGEKSRSVHGRQCSTRRQVHLLQRYKEGLMPALKRTEEPLRIIHN